MRRETANNGGAASPRFAPPSPRPWAVLLMSIFRKKRAENIWAELRAQVESFAKRQSESPLIRLS